MKALFGFVVLLILTGLGTGRVRAEFTSIYTFGDGLCSTTDNVTPPPLDAAYYENRYCNGRVWIEVLTQWQGLSYDSNKNWSYFGHDSTDLIANVAAFSPPPDVSTALFVVWVNNADFVNFMFGNTPPYTSGDIPAWTNFVNHALTNHYEALTNLYDKGVRTLVLPSASDVSAAPFFGLTAANRSFVRARVIEFNSQFGMLVDDLGDSFTNLTIHLADSFALIDDALANPSAYGISKTNIDAVTDFYPAIPALDGPGADYAFWDDLHPSAKLQQHLAELVQKLLSSAEIASITAAIGTNQLGVTNIPAMEPGQVEVSTNLTDWTSVLSFTNATTSGTVAVPAAGTKEFYRLFFPLTWTWP